MSLAGHPLAHCVGDRRAGRAVPPQLQSGLAARGLRLLKRLREMGRRHVEDVFVDRAAWFEGGFEGTLYDPAPRQESVAFLLCRSLEHFGHEPSHPAAVDAVAHLRTRREWGQRADRIGREDATVDGAKGRTVGRGLVALEK